MMKRWALSLLLVICTAAVPSAIAQTSSFVSFGSLQGHPPVSIINVPAQMSGELTVSFHGDPSAGCAAEGICGYSGTVVFRPGSQGDLALSKYRIRGRDSYEVELSVLSFPGTTYTGARVTRAGGGVCSDAQQPNGALPGIVTGSHVAIKLIQPQEALLSTRCAGPLDADLAGVGPQILLTLGQLRRGDRILPLSGTWSFASGGYAGIVESNLTVRLGKPATQRNLTSSSFPRGIKSQRDRQVTETLTLVRATGGVSLGLGADPSTCQFLDSCGIHGTIDGTFAPTGATASLSVLGPATRPEADYLAALGLSRLGNPHGLQVAGAVGWAGGGTVTAQLEQGHPCASSGPMPGGVVLLLTSGRRLTATFSAVGPLRTRCPGPELGQSLAPASGAVALSALGRPSFTLHLSGGSGTLSDDGYTISRRTSLTLTLRRGRVRQQTFLAPAG